MFEQHQFLVADATWAHQLYRTVVSLGVNKPEGRDNFHI
jgi:hypothetical protein